MTKEEAIKELELIAKAAMWKAAMSNDRREAVEMAIESLSREQKKSVVTEKTIKPEPIIKKRQWISVNRVLPKDDDWKIVTILDEHGDAPYRYTDFGWYLEQAKCWIIEAEQRTDVIAWAPLPEPYKEEEDD